MLALAIVVAAVPLFASEIPMSAPALEPVNFAWRVAVATDGRDFLVAWTEPGNLGVTRIRYARVLRSGVVADIPAKLLAAQAGSHPSVAFTSGRYLITWTSGTRVACALLDRDGNVLRRLSLEAGPYVPRWYAAAADGHFLVAWTEQTEQGGRTTGVIISPEGEITPGRGDR